MTVFGTGCCREERTECDTVCEQGARERRRQSATVFGNRVLEREKGRV